MLSSIPSKPFHLYDLAAYVMAKVSDDNEMPIPATTYAKGIRGAMRTFKENHKGDFVLVSGSNETPIHITNGGNWFELNPQVLVAN